MHTVLQSLAKTWETPTKESDKICICQRKVMQMKRQSRRMMGKEISSRDVLDKIPYKCIPKIYSIQTRRDFVLILCKNRRDFRLWSSVRRTKSNRLLSLQEQMTYPGKRNDYQEHVSSNHSQQDEQQVSDDVEKRSSHRILTALSKRKCRCQHNFWQSFTPVKIYPDKSLFANFVKK